MTPPGFDIRVDDVSGPAVLALLQEHLQSVVLYSPPESVHALNVEELRAPDVTFFSAWQGAGLMGCGALKQLDAEHGEIKSMRTRSAQLRRGVAAALLEHILAVAHERGYTRVSLETGSMEAFSPARALYARFGFQDCGPFADYVEDPNSIFMTRTVDVLR